MKNVYRKPVNNWLIPTIIADLPSGLNRRDLPLLLPRRLCYFLANQ
jgi:hypothetical protein